MQFVPFHSVFSLPIQIIDSVSFHFVFSVSIAYMHRIPFHPLDPAFQLALSVSCSIVYATMFHSILADSMNPLGQCVLFGLWAATITPWSAGR
jgi:hypothetical protein